MSDYEKFRSLSTRKWKLVGFSSDELVDGMRKRWGLDGAESPQNLIKVVPWSGHFPVVSRPSGGGDDLEGVIRDVASWMDTEESEKLTRTTGGGVDLEDLMKDVLEEVAAADAEFDALVAEATREKINKKADLVFDEKTGELRLKEEAIEAEPQPPHWLPPKKERTRWRQDTPWDPNYDLESEQENYQPPYSIQGKWEPRKQKQEKVDYDLEPERENYQPPYSTSRKWSAWKPEPKKVDYQYLRTGPDTFEKVTIADVDPWDNLWSLGPAFWEKMKDDQPNKPKVWSSGRDPSQPFEPKK